MKEGITDVEVEDVVELVVADVVADVGVVVELQRNQLTE